MKLQYTYTRVHVSDYEACKEFYRDILGFEVTFEGEKYAELSTGETKITLLQREKLQDIIGKPQAGSYAESDDTIALSFKVSNMDEARRELSNKGVKFINSGPWNFPDWGYKSSFFRDPDGNLIELVQLLS